MLWLSINENLIRPDSPVVEKSVGESHYSVIADDGDSIPNIVFQTWKTRHQLPSNFAYWRKTFLKHNPTYRHVLWDDHDNRKFIAQRFPWFMDIYDGFPMEIFRADVIRLFFLYTYGGFYADLDSECIRPLDDLRSWGDVLVGRMGKNLAFPHSIPNAVMASKPKQIFWLLAIAIVIECFAEATKSEMLNEMGPEQLTGPIPFKAAVEYYSSHSLDEIKERAAPVLRHIDDAEYRFGKLSVLPPYIWYPIDWTNPVHQIFRRKMSRRKAVLAESSARSSFRHSYVVNYWSHSWGDT
jgi:mannosyltransferase OCH1-like enzyme